MISYGVYKIVHYLGIFALVTAVAAALGRAAFTGAGSGDAGPGTGPGAGDDGGSGGPSVGRDPWRGRLAAVHGTALFLVLLGGFGMLARIGVEHGALFPGWVWGKLGIWVVIGGLIAVARRSPRWSARALWAVPLLAAAAGILAFTKVL